jgi:hypothetical protein
MAKLSTDLGSPRLLHPRENLFVTGTLGSLNAEVIVNTDGAASFSIDLRGTFSMTVELSGTVDGTNWTFIPVRPIGQIAVAYVAAITGTAAGVWAGTCAPFRQVRARVTAYTSGAAVATLMASTAPLDDSLQGRITPLLVTATGAAAAAVTLTLPAPGAGLRQYLTYLRVTRFAAAALTAAATPVLITTTNIPGSLVFTAPADAALQGTTTPIVSEDWASALAGSALNTAMTVVCPVTTGVIWRVSGGYYIAP